MEAIWKMSQGNKDMKPGRSDFQIAISRQTSCSQSGTSDIKGLQRAPGPHLHMSRVSRAFSPGGGLHENAPLDSSYWNCLGTIKRRGLAGGGVSLASKFQKVHTIPRYRFPILLVGQDVNKLSAIALAPCLLAGCHASCHCGY